MVKHKVWEKENGERWIRRDVQEVNIGIQLSLSFHEELVLGLLWILKSADAQVSDIKRWNNCA